MKANPAHMTEHTGPISTSRGAVETSHYLKSFSGLSVAGEQLEGIEFESCAFVDCDMSAATFRRCRFIDCSFIGSNLNHVVLSSSRFNNVEFKRCKLVGVNWTTVEQTQLVRSPGFRFRDCILDESSFFGLALEELVLQGCKARAVDFREAGLRAADLTFTDFSGAVFGRTDLTEADFSEASGYDIDVLNNTMTRAKFSRFEAVRLLQGLDVEVVD